MVLSIRVVVSFLDLLIFAFMFGSLLHPTLSGLGIHNVGTVKLEPLGYVIRVDIFIPEILNFVTIPFGSIILIYRFLML